MTSFPQAQVNHAPTFPQVLKLFARFLAQHGLIDPKNGRPLQRFCWCSDGPFDVRDFVVKQCFISKVSLDSGKWNGLTSNHQKYSIPCQIPMPPWLRGDILDVRRVVSAWLTSGAFDAQQVRTKVGHRLSLGNTVYNFAILAGN